MLSTKEGQAQKELWRLGAVLHLINFTTPSTSGLDLAFQCGLYACVQQPYAMITGNINITYEDEKYTVTCENCNWTNCVRKHNSEEDILLIHQPPFLMIQVTVTGPWYADAGLQALEELHKTLSCPKRALSLFFFNFNFLLLFNYSCVSFLPIPPPHPSQTPVPPPLPPSPLILSMCPL